MRPPALPMRLCGTSCLCVCEPSPCVCVYMYVLCLNAVAEACRGGWARALLPALPLAVYGLPPHARKLTVLHLSILRHPLAGDVIVRSKDPLVVQAGCRRWDARPLFSEQGRGDKHRRELYLRPGRATVASLYAPTCFPPTPVLLWRAPAEPGDAPLLVASGSVLAAAPRRVVLKRIVLTGALFKLHRHVATVRYMFHHRADVNWFRPVALHTKGGRAGHIVGPLGTHGYMKCRFNGPLRADDVVCMALYKRVYPPWRAELRRPELRVCEPVTEKEEEEEEEEEDEAPL
jgi:pre-rRNA-processing protein TSR1